jgi:DnaJ domain
VPEVTLDDALAALAVTRGASEHDVRTAYRRLIGAAHPDRASDDPEATRRTARLTQAYAVVRRALTDGQMGAEVVPADPVAQVVDTAAVAEVDQDSIVIDVPADEAFAALFEAAGRVGHVAYFDRNLGLLETVVRFEGGPTCSVLITLQGRAYGTEAFCTMESIEAAPTPPIAPVIDALVEELTAQRSSP